MSILKAENQLFGELADAQRQQISRYEIPMLDIETRETQYGIMANFKTVKLKSMA